MNKNLTIRNLTATDENMIVSIFIQNNKNLLKIKTFFISHNTIEWKNGADFSPEFLFEIGE